MAKKRQPRNEFRRNNNKDGRSHPAYIYEKVGNEYRFIGITHAPITIGIKNIPLEDNPNPNDDSQSYARPKAEKAHQASFGKKLKGWRLSDKNKKIINQIKKIRPATSVAKASSMFIMTNRNSIRLSSTVLKANISQQFACCQAKSILGQAEQIIRRDIECPANKNKVVYTNLPFATQISAQCSLWNPC